MAYLADDTGWFNVDPAILGVALSMLLQIAGTNFPWMVKLSADVTNHMIAVERVLAFGELPRSIPRRPTSPRCLLTSKTHTFRSKLIFDSIDSNESFVLVACMYAE